MEMKTQTFTLLVTVRESEAGTLSENEFAHIVESLLRGKRFYVSPLDAALVSAAKGIHTTAFDQDTRHTHRHADF
jgi:hypothetical protein